MCGGIFFVYIGSHISSRFLALCACGKKARYIGSIVFLSFLSSEVLLCVKFEACGVEGVERVFEGGVVEENWIKGLVEAACKVWGCTGLFQRF